MTDPSLITGAVDAAIAVFGTIEALNTAVHVLFVAGLIPAVVAVLAGLPDGAWIRPRRAVRRALDGRVRLGRRQAHNTRPGALNSPSGPAQFEEAA